MIISNSCSRFCCNVGCCYHLLQEESVETPSFPVSSVLKERNFRLGRNPLMLAAQPMDRSIANKEVCLTKLNHSATLCWTVQQKVYFNSKTNAQTYHRFWLFLQSELKSWKPRLEMLNIISIFYICEAEKHPHLNDSTGWFFTSVTNETINISRNN